MRKSFAIATTVSVLVFGLIGLSISFYQNSQYRYCMRGERWKLDPSAAQVLQDFRFVRDPDVANRVAATRSRTEAAQVLCKTASQAAVASLFR